MLAAAADAADDEADLLATAAANSQDQLLDVPELFEAETLVVAIAGAAVVNAALDD